MTALLLLVLAQLLDETPWLPPLTDLKSFPSGEEASEQVRLYRQHLEWIEWSDLQPVLDGRFGRDYWRMAKRLTLCRLGTWELLAQSQDRLEEFRGWGIPPRVFLHQLRDRLEDSDYRAGRMPPRLLPKGMPKVKLHTMPAVGNTH